MNKHSRKYRRENITLLPETQTAMLKHLWLGNVRELSHAIERAVIMSDQNNLDIQSLGLGNHANADKSEQPLMTLEESEKRTIIRAIQHFSGNVITAGEYLGLSKSAIYRRLEKLEVDPKKLDL